MSTVLAKWMTLFISINIMFTPILAYSESLNREAVDLVLYEALKQASVQGRFSEEIMQNMISSLVDDYGFVEDDILITATVDPTPRGEIITASIEVPSSPIFILDIFTQGPDTYVRTAEIMSEYVE